MSLKYGDRVVA